ncbi:potassium channel family protein [Bacteroidota bacterium]
MYKSESFKPMYIAFGFLMLIVTIGIAGYMIIENFGFLEAYFQTIITISTVGFQEVSPLSAKGRVFTTFLIIFSFGIFAYALTTFTRYVIDGVFRNYYKLSKLKKRIEKLNNHVIVVGYGRNGSQAIEELTLHKINCLVIEKNESKEEELQQLSNALYFIGDATKDETLQSVNISTARALITTLPSDADNLFVVLTAREMNKKLDIISRASDSSSEKKLKIAGATNVILPDKIGGQHMAKLVAQADVVEFIDKILLNKPDEVNLEKVSCKGLDPSFVEKSIGDAKLRKSSGANIIGIKKFDGTYIFNPSAEMYLRPHDELLVLGKPDQIETLMEILHGKKLV